ncbi:hypothetical protein GOB85_13430 [Acetobacter sp. LMG 1636]|uniref:Uncharacterized protein n=2 Tax=Acetobacter fallax TaxID=1737473 RepID=A0ABX0KAQ6_9PROT|nr:hypothetical protein [Acetobacter fallax]NHO33490.1 hypothetical protein [Acetobacter fallax]NHO37102.1 hypothetical protein [Acetobacter fallax]
MALLACGRAEGIERFRGTVNSFLAALSPGIAFNLVSFFLALLQKDTIVGLIRVELSLCAFLALPVISFLFARKWGREDRWLRYATASAWSEWTSLFICVVVMALAALVMPALADRPGFGHAVMFSSQLYDLWLGMFIARCGLDISRGRAVLVYGAATLFVLVCYSVASLLPPHYPFLTEILLGDFGPHNAVKS